MTSTARTTEVPMTRGERLWYALKRGGVGVAEMADELDITRQSLGAWISDRTQKVPTLYLRAIAHRTGFREEWLRDGTGSPFADDGGSYRSVIDQYPPSETALKAMVA